MTENPVPPATPPRQSLPLNVRVLGLASLVNDIASEAIFPLLPDFLLTVLLGSRFSLGVIEGTADSAASFLKLWAGAKSDQAGRRKGFVIFGYSVAAFARPLIGVIAAPWQLFTLRVGDRIGKGIRSSPRDALVADSTDPSIRGRAFGFHRAMDHLGAALGPLLAAGFLWVWPGELRTLFLLTILPGLLVVVLVVLGLRERTETRPAKNPLSLTLRPFDRNFRWFLLALLIFTLGNSSDAFLLVRAGELGVPTAMLPLLWCSFHIVKSTANFVLGRAVDRFGPRPFLLSGWLLYAGVYLAFALATSERDAWVCFLSYALFYGLTEPAEKTLVADIVGDERKGLAYGWYNFAIGIATLPASLICGALYQAYGAAAAFGWGAVLALVAAGMLMRVKGQRPDPLWTP
jgi:MFS family permease